MGGKTAPIIGINTETGEKLRFPSVKAASEFLNVHSGQISNAIVRGYRLHGYLLDKAEDLDMFEYDKLASEAVRCLDRCDLSADIDHCRRAKIRDAYDVRQYIISAYPFGVEEALDNLSLDEFMEYLTARYNVRWAEISRYEMY